jgi:hypothetical protein
MYEKKPRPVQFSHASHNLTVSLRPRNPIIGTVACCARAASPPKLRWQFDVVLGFFF